ncbi:MAG: Eco57I restriction-modification methylase domain-containing protein, partial [Fidelibacterota bacterium]
MKLYEAKDLIRDVFEHAYDKDRYTRLIKNLLKDFEEKTFTYQGNIIPNAFENYIRKMERIGKFEDEEGNTIDILVVELLREHSIEYARSTQRNFVRWYLNGSRGGQMKDAALVAFHSEKSSDWRFSLIKMQYSLESKKDEFTPAKRFSFLVGEKGKSHTAQRQLVKLLQSDDIPRLPDLEEAFNIETVTREFFLKYRELLIRTKEALDKVVNNDPKIKADFACKGVDTVNFAKKLLGQIVF